MIAPYQQPLSTIPMMSVPRPTPTPTERPRFLSEADCHDIAHRLARFAMGGGYTSVVITSTWRGNVRWARNLVSTSGEVRNDSVQVTRDLRGARYETQINEITDAWLVAAARRAERVAQLEGEETENYDILLRHPPESVSGVPSLFSDATYQLDAGRRAEVARTMAKSAADAGMLSAGYIEVSAHSQALIGSWGFARYFQYTWAQYSVTVRDPTGTGSGWAGVDFADWSKIDGATLSTLALEKCLQSRNPVAIEPGRYTTILESQAVGDFVGRLFFGGWTENFQSPLEKWASYSNRDSPFNLSENVSRLGQPVVDERITITADPMDPALRFPPFSIVRGSNSYGITDYPVYHPATWIEHGVLKNLEYDQKFAVQWLGKNDGLPNSGAFRMSGGETSIDEMIATTKRGLLVTRLDLLTDLDVKSLLVRGYTRDGLWLIENGKISKPVKNMVFTESILFALNNVEQLGVPQRVFHPPGYGLYTSQPQPVVVPPMKVKDFSFTALSDAV